MSVWSDLELDPRIHRLISLVGGGGKTTLMYALAREATAQGLRVIVTTTTHIRPHPTLPTTDCPELDRLRQLLTRPGVLLVGRPTQGGKLAGAGDAASFLSAADVVLVEADGSKGLPLKAPAGHEPVIPPRSDAVIAVVGADCVGRPIEQVCHRPERVCALLESPPQHLVQPKDIVRIVTSPLGGRKSVAPGMAFRCAVNKSDRNPRAASELRFRLQALGVPTAVTSFTEQERDGKCLF